MLRCMLFMLNISKIGMSYKLIFNVVFLPQDTHTHTHTRIIECLWCMLKLKKFNSIIVALVYVGGGDRNHFSKKREFIITIMHPCGQEGASGRLETQIWNSGDSLKYIHLSSLPLLCTWFIIHSFCWLATSVPQNSQRKMANHSLTEGPNPSISMFFCLSFLQS